jgi:hypothetical protein
MDTFYGSFDAVAKIASLPVSSKGFELELSPASNKKRLENLNITLTLYLPYRSTL